MGEEWRKWKHITKLDPDKKVSARVIKTIVDSKTDAIMISGTLGVTQEKVQKVIDLLKDYSIPKILEPATPSGVVYKGYDYMFVPSVFNTDNSSWINGIHKNWVKTFKDNINWDIVVPEALIILNPKCSAAKLTKAKKLNTDETIAAAICAERYFKFPVVYIEYSGTYGNPALVKAVKENLKSAHLIYGGGIKTQQQAEEMSQHATIVVGNTIYEEGVSTFVNTMRGTLMKELKVINERLTELKKLKEKEDKKNGKPNISKESFKVRMGKRFAKKKDAKVTV